MPAERSVGHAVAAEVADDAGVPVPVAVGAAEEEGRPKAEQLNPPVLNVTLSQPVVSCNASLKML